MKICIDKKIDAMAFFNSNSRSFLWLLILVFIVLAVISWYWFDQQIHLIDHQIDHLHQ